MIAAFLLILAAAQNAPVDCAHTETQLDLNECAGSEFAAADADLNKQWKVTLARMRSLDSGDTYAKTMGDTRPGYAQTLLNAQRAWLTYREAHCTSEGYYARGGSMESMLYNECRTSLTIARTEQLAELAKNDE